MTYIYHNNIFSNIIYICQEAIQKAGLEAIQEVKQKNAMEQGEVL
jgi:hypothetical protein